MSPATISLCVLLSLLLMAVPRRMLVLPFIIAACLVPMNQRIEIAGLDFPVLRILLLVCVIRLFARDEVRTVAWNSFDKLILTWNIVGALIYVILWGTLQSLIYKCGTMFDSLGMYWIFRQYIQSFDDITEVIKNFAVLAIVSAPLIAAEKIRETSFFSIFGPVVSRFHHGRFRCSGPFSHYIIMGVFWSSLLPFFYAKIKVNSSPLFYWTATLSALACVYFSASSTPIMTVAAIIVFWHLYNYRVHGKEIFWSIVIILIALHFAMKAPIWHLMARLDVFGGSTGWFRYYLFDEFVKHTSDWFFLGTQNTAAWGRGLSDITNQYVFEAVRGGFITLSIFIYILYNAVKITGNYSILNKNLNKRFISWGACVCMLGHIVTFWGVSYFSQIDMLLTLNFAIVGFIEEETIKFSEKSFELNYAR